MSRPASRFLWLGGLAAAAAAALAWALLAPGALGGSTAYVIVEGSSMTPTLAEGDLAILRDREHYEVGDVVGYRSAELGRVVLHRIVAKNGNHYVFKGDANSFKDAEQPVDTALVGELWMRVPQAGSALAWLQTPRNAAIVAAAVALVLLLGGGAGHHARGRRRRGESSGSVATGPEAAAGRSPGRVALAVAGCLLGLSIVVGLVAFTRPLQREVALAGAYEERGALSYDAAVQADAVYPDGAVSTGEPVFLRQVDRLRVAFAYELRSERSRSASGTVGLVAELGDGSGWSRTIELAPPEPFTGDQVTTAGTLDLRTLQTMVRDFERETGTDASSYLVTLVPRVDLSATVGGTPVSSTFSPRIALRLDDQRLTPDTGSGTEVSYLHERPGSIRVLRANELRLHGSSVSVSVARAIALFGAAVAIAASLAAWGLDARRRGSGEPARIASRHGTKVVPVLGPIADEHAQVVDVEAMESLVRLAAHYDRAILHQRSDDGGDYGFREGETIYRYRAAESSDRAGDALAGTALPADGPR
jgi:signal peptidase I